MPTVTRLMPPGYRFQDTDGTPLAGGKVYTYTTGTTTPETAYTDSAGDTAHANPIILDSTGLPPSGGIWLTLGTNYRIKVTDSDDVEIETMDDVAGVSANSNLVITDDSGLIDDNDNYYLRFQSISSAVNYIEVTNAAASNAPKIAAQGTDSNIDLQLDAKGSGDINFGSSSTAATINMGGSADNIINVNHEDTRTSTTAYPLIIKSSTSGTPTTNIGTGIQMQTEAADGLITSGQVGAVLSDVSSGSEDSFIELLALKAGTLKQAYQFYPSDYIVQFYNNATANKTVTFPNNNISFGGLKAGFFNAYRSNSLTVSNTWAKLHLDSEEFDAEGWFASEVYTPQQSGYYFVSASAKVTSGTVSGTANNVGITIYKNGSSQVIPSHEIALSSNETAAIQCCGLIYLNGSADYVEPYGYVEADVGASNWAVGTRNMSFFGFMVCPTFDSFT